MKNRVLIIDEELVLIEPLLDIMRWEYPLVECIHYRTGYAGLNDIRNTKCDLVILDMMLPLGDPNIKEDKPDLLNGIIILEKIREIEACKDLPIICYTVLNDEDVVRDILRLGALHICKIQEKSSDYLFESIDKVIKNK